MGRCIAESFRFDRESCIAQSRSCFSFQLNQGLRQALIASDAHRVHVRHEITIRKEEFCRENLSADFQTFLQVRLIAIRDTEISIAEKMFQLVGHREYHRILRQPFRNHYRRSEIIINKRPAEISESIRPFINFDSVVRVDSPEIAGEYAW